MAVALQAFDWQMSPFAVANKTYFVSDRIAFEAQLVAAVVHTRAPIKSRPVYEFVGEGATRQCIVKVQMLEGTVKEYISPEIGKIKVKNSPLWTADPDQQLGYFSIRAWARRHCPEVIMGVYTPEEAQQIAVVEHDTATSFDDLEARANAKDAPAAIDGEFEDARPTTAEAATEMETAQTAALDPVTSASVDDALAASQEENSSQEQALTHTSDGKPPQEVTEPPEGPKAAQEASEPETPASEAPSGFVDYATAVSEANDWPQIDHALGELRRSTAWNESGKEMQAKARFIAFDRLSELVKAGYKFDFITNLQAWRCYIEFEQDPEALRGNRDVVSRQPMFKDLPTNAKIALDKAYDDRQAILQAAAPEYA